MKKYVIKVVIASHFDVMADDEEYAKEKLKHYLDFRGLIDLDMDDVREFRIIDIKDQKD